MGLLRRKPLFEGCHRLPLVAWGQVGIVQGHLNVFMPQEFLHGSEVSASHDEARGEGVTQGVRAARVDPSTLAGSAEYRREVPKEPRFPGFRHKHRRRVAAYSQGLM